MILHFISSASPNNQPKLHWASVDILASSKSLFEVYRINYKMMHDISDLRAFLQFGFQVNRKMPCTSNFRLNSEVNCFEWAHSITMDTLVGGLLGSGIDFHSQQCDCDRWKHLQPSRGEYVFHIISKTSNDIQLEKVANAIFIPIPNATTYFTTICVLNNSHGKLFNVKCCSIFVAHIGLIIFVFDAIE